MCDERWRNKKEISSWRIYTLGSFVECIMPFNWWLWMLVSRWWLVSTDSCVMKFSASATKYWLMFTANEIAKGNGEKWKATRFRKKVQRIEQERQKMRSKGSKWKRQRCSIRSFHFPIISHIFLPQDIFRSFQPVSYQLSFAVIASFYCWRSTFMLYKYKFYFNLLENNTHLHLNLFAFSSSTCLFNYAVSYLNT